MNISSATDYAIKCMLYLASIERRATSTEVANAVSASDSVVRKILYRLKSGNLLRSEYGIDGGYELARMPDDISVYDIMSLTESTMSFYKSLGNVFEPHTVFDIDVHRHYSDMQEQIHDYLKEVKLSQLVATN